MIRPGATVPTDHQTRGPIDSSGRATLENEATPTWDRSRSRVGTKPISSRGEADRASERSQFRHDPKPIPCRNDANVARHLKQTKLTWKLLDVGQGYPIFIA